MKKVILLLLFSLAFGQWIDTIIRLRDSTYPSFLCYSSRNNKVYCVLANDSILVLDGLTNEVITSFWSGVVYHLCYNSRDNKVYGAKPLEGVLIIDPVTDSILKTLPVGRHISSLYYNSYNNKLYCAVWSDSIVAIIDGTTDSILRRVQVGAGPRAFCYNHRNNKVYCANYESGNISVIDGSTNMLINTIPAGNGATALCYNSVNNKVYCANYEDSSITVINGTTDSVIHTIHIDFPPEVLTYNFRRNKIYSGCFFWGCRYGGVVIDGNSDSVIIRFPQMYGILSSYYNWINDKVYLGPFVIDGVTDSVITYLPYEPIQLVWDSLQNKTYGTFCNIYGVSLIMIIRDSILPAIEEKSTSQIIRSSVLKTKENLFDITGRKIERQHLRRGVYFLKKKEYIQKVILIK